MRAKISIHALRVEGDQYARSNLFVHERFLSTPSGWRATADQHDFRDVSRISIHALRVEGDRQIGVDVEKWTAISIHALRVEGDSLRA